MKTRYAKILLPLIVLTSGQTIKPVNCTVRMSAPTELKQYLVDGPKKFTCFLSTKFALEDLQPLIATLATLPLDTDGKTTKLILVLLYDWALSAETKNKQLKRSDSIRSCIEKITDPDAHEELVYWSKKCSDILPGETNNAARSTMLDLCNVLPVPEKLTCFNIKYDPWLSDEKKVICDCWWNLPEDFSLTDIPNFINAVVSLPQTLSACARITAIQRALAILGEWAALSTEKNDTHQERLTAIKKSIDLITDQATKHEFTYWFKKGLNSLLLNPGIKGRTQALLNLLLNNGAYLKSWSNIDHNDLFSYPTLDENLYNKLKKIGLKPTPLSLILTIREQNTALDTLLNHSEDINSHEQFEEVGNIYIKSAMDWMHTYALRKLIQKGISINQKSIEGETPLKYLVNNRRNSDENSKMFHLLLGQQQNFPSQIIDDLQYNPSMYADLINIKATDHKALAHWISTYGEYSIPAALYEFGTTQQLRDGIALFMKNQQHRKELTNNAPQKQKLLGAIYATRCIEALKSGADMGFFRLLSLAVQQQIIQKWMFEKGREKIPENQFLPNKKAQAKIFTAFKNSEWPIGEYEMVYVTLALEPVRIQERLNGIVTTNQKEPKLRDIKILIKK